MAKRPHFLFVKVSHCNGESEAAPHPPGWHLRAGHAEGRLPALVFLPDIYSSEETAVAAADAWLAECAAQVPAQAEGGTHIVKIVSIANEEGVVATALEERLNEAPFWASKWLSSSPLGAVVQMMAVLSMLARWHDWTLFGASPPSPTLTNPTTMGEC